MLPSSRRPIEYQGFLLQRFFSEHKIDSRDDNGGRSWEKDKQKINSSFHNPHRYSLFITKSISCWWLLSWWRKEICLQGPRRPSLHLAGRLPPHLPHPCHGRGRPPHHFRLHYNLNYVGWHKCCLADCVSSQDFAHQPAHQEDPRLLRGGARRLHGRPPLPLPSHRLCHPLCLQDPQVPGRLQRDPVHPVHQLHQHDPLAGLGATLLGEHRAGDPSSDSCLLPLPLCHCPALLPRAPKALHRPLQAGEEHNEGGDEAPQLLASLSTPLAQGRQRPNKVSWPPSFCACSSPPTHWACRRWLARLNLLGWTSFATNSTPHVEPRALP